MKKRTKGIIAFAFLGGIMVTSGVVIGIPGIAPMGSGPSSGPLAIPLEPNGILRGYETYSIQSDNMVTVHEALAHDYSLNFVENSREQFCGTNNPPKSTPYIQEYLLPTECSAPMAITTDYKGNPWFTQSNTGRIATLDVANETFTEFHNPHWPLGQNAEMWGIEYDLDGTVWFTDAHHDALWYLLGNGEYGALSYMSIGSESLPQKLEMYGMQLVINDFVGNYLSFFNPSIEDGRGSGYLLAPSPIDGAVTSDFAFGDGGTVWFTNWAPMRDGQIVRLDYNAYASAAAASGSQYLPIISYVTLYPLHPAISAPNGIAITDDGVVWIADTESSSVYSFDPNTRQYTQYPTTTPMPSIYGNQAVEEPISRPYWIEKGEDEKIIFNAQESNNISVLDHTSQSIVEYQVPSKNPYWYNCTMMIPDDSFIMEDKDTTLENCGIAQILDIAVDEERIWFTEWAENKIGVVDTSAPLPIEIHTHDSPIVLQQGGIDTLNFTATLTEDGIDVISTAVYPARPLIATSISDITETETETFNLILGEPVPIDVIVSAPVGTPTGTYKILLGVQTLDVMVGKFVTVIVL